MQTYTPLPAVMPTAAGVRTPPRPAASVLSEETQCFARASQRKQLKQTHTPPRRDLPCPRPCHVAADAIIVLHAAAAMSFKLSVGIVP